MSFVASAASTAAIAAPSIASAMPADPILAAIERHMAAMLDLNWAVDRQAAAEQADDPHREERVQLVHEWEARLTSAFDGKDDDACGIEVRCGNAWRNIILDSRYGREAQISVMAWKSVRALRPSLFSDQEGPELIEASKLADQLGGAERDAAWTVVTTVPETWEGIRAVLGYVRELGDRGDLGFQEAEYVEALNWSIEAAVCLLTGQPEPPEPKSWRDAEAA